MSSDPEEFDSRLRERLEALAASVPDRGGKGDLARPKVHSNLPAGGLLLAVIVLIGVAAFGTWGGVAPGAPIPEASPRLSAPAAGASSSAVGVPPPGGISEDAAIALARKVVDADARLISASAGRFSDVRPQEQRIGPAFPIKPDTFVWAIAFEDQFEICPPDGSACMSPRPGTQTGILDYVTGEVLSTFGYSPP
jgi:hypothetical protein